MIAAASLTPHGIPSGKYKAEQSDSAEQPRTAAAQGCPSTVRIPNVIGGPLTEGRQQNGPRWGQSHLLGLIEAQDFGLSLQSPGEEDEQKDYQAGCFLQGDAEGLICKSNKNPICTKYTTIYSNTLFITKYIKASSIYFLYNFFLFFSF